MPSSPPAAATRAATSGSLISPNSTQAKIDLAATALRLRDEQIEAKVTYFGADQATNKELDAITDAVIAELKALQSAGVKPGSAHERSDVEIELISALRELLERLFSGRRQQFLRRKIADIQRRITTLFFNSELYARLSADAREGKTMSWDDQAVYHALRQHKDALITTLRSMHYASPDVLDDAIARLESVEKGLRMAYLSRTTPELEKLLEIYKAVLERFFFDDFKSGLGEFCWEVVRESRVAQGRQRGYKLGPDVFQSFREVFDKKFLERLVLNVQEPIVQRAGEMRGTFREDTLRFVADPQIFSEICTVVCDSLYDYLYSEGFLDLPARWREHLARQ